MRKVRCDFCKADDYELMFELKDYLHHIEGTFRLVRCRRCGLIYLNPQPTREELRKYYPNDYHAYKPLSSVSSPFERLDRYYGIDKRCRAVVKRLKERKGRVLDIGCATGEFLYSMRRYGNWELYGVEPNVEAAMYARNVLGLNVFIGTLFEAQYPNAFFDVVTLWNVLEHLHYPLLTLREIARIIKPSGLLVISIPNPESIEARIFGRYWAGFDAPRHLFIYPLSTLKKALDLVGFDVKKVRSFTGRYHVLALSIGHWLDAHISNEKRAAFLKRAISSFFFRVLTYPYYILAGWWNISSVATVFAVARCHTPEDRSGF